MDKKKDMYDSCEDVRNMLDFLLFHKGREEYNSFLDYVRRKSSVSDSHAIQHCISTNCYESFNAYDSDVREQFTRHFEEFFICSKSRNTYKPKSQYVVIGELDYWDGHRYLVIDTMDGVIEAFSDTDLLAIAKMGISIDGVNTFSGIEVIY